MKRNFSVSELSGLLLVDKPKGITSHDVVAQVRRRLAQKSVGHAGTLDPAATGLLQILLGEATKLSDQIMEGDKEYLARIVFGLETDTWDMDGEVISREAVDLEAQRISREIAGLQGRLELPVPRFSAVKVAGKKLCDRARNNQDFAPPVRDMNFRKVEVLLITPREAWVQLTCDKGGYVRSWVHELGRRMGCGATLSELRRTRSGSFKLSAAVTLKDLNPGQSDGFVPLESLLPNLQGYSIEGRDLKLLENGQIPNSLLLRLIPEQKRVNQMGRSELVKVYSGQPWSLRSLLELCPHKSPKIRRNFQNSSADRP